MRSIKTSKKPEQYLIDSIAAGNSKVINEVYNKYGLLIRRIVKNNNGTNEDAEDLFQEGMLAIYKITQKRKLLLTCSFSTFLYRICQNIWWAKLKKKSIVKVGYLEEVIAIDPEIADESYMLYVDQFEQLPQTRKKILNLYLDGYNMKQITKIMELKNEDYTRKLKYKCKQQLIKLIQSDYRYQELVA